MATIIQGALDGAMKIYGYVATGISALVIIAGVVWYVWRGKDIAQLKESEQGWKGLAEQKSAKIAQLEADVKDLKSALKERDIRIQELEQEVRGLAKVLARVQGKRDTEESELL